MRRRGSAVPTYVGGDPALDIYRRVVWISFKSMPSSAASARTLSLHRASDG